MHKVWQAVSKKFPQNKYGYKLSEDGLTYSLSVTDDRYHKSAFGSLPYGSTPLEMATEYARINRELDGR